MPVLRAVRRRHVWLAAPFVALLAPLSRPVSDNSFLWHVRAGSLQLEAGEVLRSDPFTLMSGGSDWRTQSWLAELGYGWLESMVGGVGWSVAIVAIALVSAGSMVVLRGSRLGGRLPALVGLGLFFVFQSFSFAVPRPVVLTYPLLAAVALLVDDDEAELWLAPPLIWLWASLHGSFVLGLGVLVLDALRRRNLPRATVVVVAGAAASLSAHGFAIWSILIDFLTNRETLGFIEEWSRPDLTDVRVAPFFVVIAAFVVLAATRRMSTRDLVVAVPFAIFGMTAVRNVMPALIVVAPVVAAALSPLPRSDGHGEQKEAAPPELPMANAAIIVGLVVLLSAVVLRPHPLDADRFPAPEVLAALDSGPVFHDDAVGGYLIWARGPDRQVFIDDRAELHGPEAFRTMGAIMAGEGAVESLEQLGIDQAIVSRDEPLVAVLEAAGWIRRADDGRFVLLAAGT